MITVVPYDPVYRDVFIRLNLEWIERYFRVEPNDVEMLYGVDSLIAEGAQVFVALDDNVPISVCLALPKGDGIWELCKLATAQGHRGRGAGTAVVEACLDYARSNGGTMMLIVSNRILEDAIRLYLKLGFVEVPLEEREYERADIRLEMPLRLTSSSFRR